MLTILADLLLKYISCSLSDLLFALILVSEDRRQVQWHLLVDSNLLPRLGQQKVHTEEGPKATLQLNISVS